ncbi:hypothetical protein [Chondromyces apiculatus]|uniref:Uncharacterized protein n=1 Tax=Chondromyces apiculatus DSM 436 TaxID=1192034 RepID=A0A017TAT9_9BACT|nr:hypothetical protein [Chondromyces apiculatus]EYF05726.1 Hypothetical protein CAP_3016 [Chondromyces apiculatus DSM 436]
MPLRCRLALLSVALCAPLVARTVWADVPAPSTARAAPAAPAVSAAPTARMTSAPPVRGEPLRLLSAAGGAVYAQLADKTVVGLSSGEVVVDARARSEARTVVGRVLCAAGTHPPAPRALAPVVAAAVPGLSPPPPPPPPPRIVCLRAATVGGAGDEPTRRTLMLLDSAGVRREVASGSEEGYRVVPLGIHLDAQGKLRFAYAETGVAEGQAATRFHVVEGSQRREIALTPEGLLPEGSEEGAEGEGRAEGEVEPVIQMVELGGQAWLVHREGSALVARPPDEEPVEVASSASGAFRAVVGPDGWLYVVHHDPASGTARVSSSRDGRAWSLATIDGRESGEALDAAAGSDAVYVVFSSTRGSPGGGLRAATLREGRVEEAPITVHRVREGEDLPRPLLGIDGKGFTWLTYRDLAGAKGGAKGEAKKQVWSRFGRPEELLGSAGAAEERGMGGRGSYFLLTGAGALPTFWHLASLTPSLEGADGVLVESPETNVGFSLLLSANVEARWRSVNFGLSYAQGIVDEAAESIEDAAGVLSGFVQADDVLWGHDLRLSVLWGRYRGSTTAFVASGEGGEMEIRSSYIDTQLLARNRWNIKYGLGYTHLNLPTLVHTWTSTKASVEYGFSGSFLRDVSFNNLALVLGYANVDHAAGYTSRYNGPLVDGLLGGGVAFYGHEPITTDGGGTLENEVTFHLRGNVMVGWLYFRRWASLGGFGLYVRPSYTAEVGFTGLPTEPSARDESKGIDTQGEVSLLWVRHGPSLDVGAVW